MRLPRELVSEALWSSLDWAYEDADHTRHSDEYCTQQRADALENFDLNMAFFAQLDPAAFETALEEMRLRLPRMTEVDHLPDLDRVGGLYVMVLDDYRQVYIGKADDIRRRIRAHWSGTKQFDRLLFGHKHESILSVDSFRALDTTRIFAVQSADPFSLEEKAVAAFHPDFLLNRIHGGEMRGLKAFAALIDRKRRDFGASGALLPD